MNRLNSLFAATALALTVPACADAMKPKRDRIESVSAEPQYGLSNSGKSFFDNQRMTWNDTDPITYDSTKAEKVSMQDVLQKCEKRRAEIGDTIRSTNTEIIEAVCELGDMENRGYCQEFSKPAGSRRANLNYDIGDYELNVCVKGPKIITKNVANCLLEIMNTPVSSPVYPVEFDKKAEPSVLEKAEECVKNLRKDRDLAWKMGVLRDALVATLERRKRSVAGEGEWDF